MAYSPEFNGGALSNAVSGCPKAGTVLTLRNSYYAYLYLHPNWS